MPFMMEDTMYLDDMDGVNDMTLGISYAIEDPIDDLFMHSEEVTLDSLSPSGAASQRFDEIYTSGCCQ